MRVLVACEFSGIVRDAFKGQGHDAWSCDLLPTERPGNHIQDDVLQHLHEDWDMMIAHPPCTYLAVSGARWWAGRKTEQNSAIEFFLALANAPIRLIALENPIGIISSKYRKPDQIIQPWEFGHAETKATCLWLKNLSRLYETKNVKDEMLSYPAGISHRVHYASPGPERWKERSRTLRGIANAMAAQWG